MTKGMDIHAEITAQIVAAIEAGAGDFQMPWRRSGGGSTMRPVNVVTGKAYSGVNVLTLWIAAESKGYSSPVWGTFKQWLGREMPVRKGEKATLGVFYKETTYTKHDDTTGEDTEQRGMIGRAFWLFNAEQVEGYVAPTCDAPAAVLDPIATADALLRTSGAAIVHEGDRAFYSPGRDQIRLPERARFTGSPTMTPTEAYYATALHELVHWSGAKHRLDRNLTGRFGSDAYAMEELVAEIGSAFLCADLGVTSEPRADHAQYLEHWLRVLKADKRAIFHAASQSTKAATFLQSINAEEPMARAA